MKYLVSVLVSVFNANKFIQHKLDNLRSQTIFDQCEIIFINGGSCLEAQHIDPFVAAHSNCHYLRRNNNKRITIYAAWNKGIKASTAPFICNSNVDDVLAPHAIETMCTALNDNPQAILAFPNVLTSNKVNPNWGDTTSTYINTSIKGMKGPFVMWRRSVHEKYGMFNRDLWVIGDSEFWSRLDASKFIKVQDKLVIYHVGHGMERQVAPDGELYKMKDAKLLGYPKGWVSG